MIVDYEQAWLRLQALVAEKSQHGRGELLERMAVIAGECRVPAGELSRLLRLYGIEVERARSISEQGPAELASSDADEVGIGITGSRGIIDHIGGHGVCDRSGAGGSRARALAAGA